jgi:hypothetical protein
LYLLIKFEDLVPDIFVCPSAENDISMADMDVLQIARDVTQDDNYTDNDVEEFSDCMDFFSMRNLSYSYHDPYIYPLSASSSSALAVAADKNPCYDAEGTDGERGEINQDSVDGDNTNVVNQPDTGMNRFAGETQFKPDWTDDGGRRKQHGNSKNHRTEVQNVLFAGFNVKRVERPDVGVSSDNIFTHWDPVELSEGERENHMSIGFWGEEPGGNNNYDCQSQDEMDSFLGN